MSQISYIKLYNYLTEIANYERVSALRTIFRLRKLPKKMLLAVSQIIEGKTPTLVVNDISYEELVEKDGMKPIAAVLMLDWLRREPEAALSYLSECTLRSPIKPLTKEQHDELDQAIAQLEKEVKEDVKPVNSYEESSEDIDVENAPSLEDGKTSLQEFIEEISQEESLNEEKVVEEKKEEGKTEPIESQKDSSKEEAPLEELPTEEQVTEDASGLVVKKDQETN